MTHKKTSSVEQRDSKEFMRMNKVLDKIIMVDKEKGNPIGVGEATLLNFKPFMDSCGFKFEEWFEEIDATYKTGILFSGWGKNKRAVWHPFRPVPMAEPGEIRNEPTGFHLDCGKLVKFIQSKLNLTVIKSEFIKLDTKGLLLKKVNRSALMCEPSTSASVIIIIFPYLKSFKSIS